MHKELLFCKYSLFLKNINIKNESKIRVNIEGQTVLSREIKFQYIADVESCGYVKLVSVYPNRNILVKTKIIPNFTFLQNFGESFSMKFLTMSSYQNPLANATVLFDLFYLSADMTKTPSSLIPNFRLNAETDSDGYAQFANISVIKT